MKLKKQLNFKKNLIELIATNNLDITCLFLRLKPTLERLKAEGSLGFLIDWSDFNIRDIDCSYIDKDVVFNKEEISLLKKLATALTNKYEWEQETDFANGSTYFYLEDPMSFSHFITINNPETFSVNGNL